MTTATAISPRYNHLFRFVSIVTPLHRSDVRRLFAPQTLSTCCVNLVLAGFTSSHESWQQGRVVTSLRATIACAGLFASAFLISGCHLGGTPPQTSGVDPPVHLRQEEIEGREEEIIP